jgi:hypothetical protein
MMLTDLDILAFVLLIKHFFFYQKEEKVNPLGVLEPSSVVL